MSISSHLKSSLDHLLDFFSPQRRKLKDLRAKWGQVAVKEEFAVSRYFDLTRDSRKHTVDDKTWTDLELPKVFETLDSTESPLGSQYLFRRLRTYVESSSDLAQYHACCEILRSGSVMREEIQLRLSALQDEPNARLADTIFGPIPPRKFAMSLLPLWSLACLVTLAVVVVMKLSIWIWLVTIGVNLLLLFNFTLPLHCELEALRGCYRMLCVAEALAALPPCSKEPQQLIALRAQASRRARALAQLGWLSALHRPGIAYLTVWLNILFLAELVAYVRTIGRVDGIRAELASTFEELGSLDAAVAVASYLERQQDYCAPLLGEGTLELEDGRHPLISRPVGNSISLNRSALVTGSNMSGKTSFIKMVGLNVIFGRTLGFCLAKRAALPATTVMASIRSEHSVESGMSRYFTELKAIQAFIDKARRGECGLILIDEIFSGTNTIERLAAGRAILESLSDNAIVLATTHDVELQEDIASRYDLYYFQEDPDVENYFDYRLRRGRSSQRNAIRLLEREGFPTDIVAAALSYSEHYAQLNTQTSNF